MPYPIRSGLFRLSIPFIGFLGRIDIVKRLKEMYAFQFHLLDSMPKNYARVELRFVTLSIPFIGFH